ncbi:MAG: peptidoglycan DD-metalloendopeptidase family protein [Bacteroidetes bacterium]|nr:peptidoglycan DD-metalloendopeptidase family protein [Bacteroidota bacterium]
MLLFLVLVTNAQDREQLEAKRKKKLDEIAFTQRLLNQTGQEQKENIGYLIILRSQIKNRQNLINSIDQEIELIANNIADTRSLIYALEQDLNALKQEYANIIYLTYRNKSTYHFLAFVFASNSITDAWRRLKLVRYYAEFRKQQVEIIKATQGSMQGKLQRLTNQVSEKELLIKNLEAEKRKLLGDTGERNRLVQQLKDKEETYKKQIEKDKKIAQDLDNAIDEIIRKEALKKASTSENTQLLSGLFADNKKKFDWPVQGVVSSNFGNQAHPTIPNVFINNNGIDISTTKDALAKCVFKGKVVHVIFIPGANNAIIVQHGEYYTVYKNLVKVKVAPGDEVAQGTVLGTVFYDDEKGTAELHFEVRKQTEKLNPVLWLKNH